MYLLELGDDGFIFAFSNVRNLREFSLEAGKLHLHGWPKKKNDDDANGE